MDEDVNAVVSFVLYVGMGRGRVEVWCKEDAIEVVFDELADTLCLEEVVVEGTIRKQIDYIGRYWERELDSLLCCQCVRPEEYSSSHFRSKASRTRVCI